MQLALTAAAQNPGYPQTAGTPELREAIAAALTRRYNMQVDRVLPVVGTKEAIAWLPTLLDMRGETVAFPSVAIPPTRWVRCSLAPRRYARIPISRMPPWSF